MVNQNKYILEYNKEYLPNTRIHVFEVFGHVRKDYFSKKRIPLNYAYSCI